ncbi:MAG TPA: GNAT family N-acetyltransferase [Propionibacteriaceae bacterium]|nr:GNAT family N-acetyltransferase [Propionibacteriaceae bacterium]
MAEYDICEVAVPASPEAEPSWVMREVMRLREAHALELIGNLDFVDPTDYLMRNYAAQDGQDWVFLVAVAGLATDTLPRDGRTEFPIVHFDAAVAREPGTLLAFAEIECPTRDNLHLAYIDVQVEAPHRRQGIGTALYSAAEAWAIAKGRTVLMDWSEHHAPAVGEAKLVPPTDVGAIPLDAGARFALRHGYALEQCERHSILNLPCDETALDRIWSEALPHASAYTLRTFEGRIPDDLVDAYVALLVHFTGEAPNAGLELEEEDWDVERIRRMEDRRLLSGRRVWNTVVTHDATGEMAAITELSCPNIGERVQHGFQNVTIVHSAHRGHRLGWLAKVANIRALQAGDPGRQRIHTWNAGENQWMLAINDAMGYQPRLVEGAWQKKLG